MNKGDPALTAREVEVFAHLAIGLADKEIGRVLGISGATVKVHAGRVYRKLGVRNRTEAAVQWTRREAA